MLLAAAIALLGLPAAAQAELVGSVSGTVTAQGRPLANAWVQLTPVTPLGEWAGRGAYTTTDARGHYSFPDVYAAHVVIDVRPPLGSGLVATFWPTAFTFDSAGVVRVTGAGAVADVDLPRGGSARGTVVDERTGAPIPGVGVSAYMVDAPWAGPTGTAELEHGPGEFWITGLPPVQVGLHVRLPEGSGYLGDGVRRQPRTRLVLDGGATSTGLVLALPRGAEVRGTVRDTSGAAVAGATVEVQGCGYACPLVTQSQDDGSYRVTGIPPSTRIMVMATRGEDSLAQWYDGVPDTIGARTLDLRAGEVADRIDFALAPAAFLSGRVLDDAGSGALPGVTVILDSLGDSYDSHFATYTREDPTRFLLGPVPAGSYRLVVYPGAGNADFVPARWVATSGIAPTGEISLAPGERAEVEVHLAASRAAQVPPGGWPGLARGFLTPERGALLDIG